MDVEPELLQVITALLGTNLVGVYDYERDNGVPHPTGALLVVTPRDLLRDRRYGLAQTLLRQSPPP